MKSLIKESRK